MVHDEKILIILFLSGKMVNILNIHELDFAVRLLNEQQRYIVKINY